MKQQLSNYHYNLAQYSVVSAFHLHLLVCQSFFWTLRSIRRPPYFTLARLTVGFCSENSDETLMRLGLLGLSFLRWRLSHQEWPQWSAGHGHHERSAPPAEWPEGSWVQGRRMKKPTTTLVTIGGWPNRPSFVTLFGYLPAIDFHDTTVPRINMIIFGTPWDQTLYGPHARTTPPNQKRTVNYTP